MGDEVKMVRVAGISAELPEKWETKFDRVNFKTIDGANTHNEGSVELVCEEEEFDFLHLGINDGFDLSLEKLSGGYRVIAKMDSEALSGLWNNGQMTFTYSEATGKWSMDALYQDREWKFCVLEPAIRIFTAGLGCVAADTSSPAIANALSSLSSGILAASADITATASLYAKESDCIQAATPDGSFDNMIMSSGGG